MIRTDFQVDARNRRFAVYRRLLDGVDHGRPSTTRPKTVYLLSSDGASPVTMKNEVDGARRIVAARHGEDALDVLRVVELRRQGPNHLLLLLGERTARRHAPVWMTKPRTTRWNDVPS